MNPLRDTRLGASLGATLRYATRSVDVEVNVDRLAAAADLGDQQRWDEALRQALPMVGLRATWLKETTRRVGERARPDLPLITFVDGGGHCGWVVLDTRRLQRVHVWSSSSFLPQGWYRLDELEREIGLGERLWARIEAALPASPLGPGAADGGYTKPLMRLRQLAHAERESVGVVVVYAVAVGVLALATPLAIQVLINWLAFGALYQPVVVLSGALLVCLTLAAGLRAAQRYAVELIQRRIFVRTVTDLGARLARIRISSLDQSYGPELVNRFFDVLTLQKASKTLLIDGMTAALQAAVGLLLLAVYHPYLLVFDVVVIGLAATALFPFLQRGEKTALKESRTKYSVAAWIEELARHPLVFKLGGLNLAETRLETLNREYLKARTEHFSVFFRQYIGMQAVQVLVQVALLLTCGWLVMEGQLTLGQLVAAEFIVASALAGLAKFTDKLEVVYDLLAGVDKLGTLMDLEPERTAGAIAPPRDEGVSIRLQNVTFSWPGGKPVLREADAEFKAASRIAVLGPDGSGKSVLADILVGLREPSSGEVWRDDQPLARLLPEQTYAETMIIRSGQLVLGTALDNVVLGRGIPEATVWDALRDLDLSHCVNTMSLGLDTELSPDGAPLSETQGRALLLARALVAPPRLLVVDGVFDGLAGPVRDRLMAPILQLPKTTTVIVLTEDPAIANRLHHVLEIREGGLHARPRLTTV